MYTLLPLKLIGASLTPIKINLLSFPVRVVQEKLKMLDSV
jgi:hypothetical protein